MTVINFVSSSQMSDVDYFEALAVDVKISLAIMVINTRGIKIGIEMFNFGSPRCQFGTLDDLELYIIWTSLQNNVAKIIFYSF